MTTDAKPLHQPAAMETSWLEKVKPYLELAQPFLVVF